MSRFAVNVLVYYAYFSAIVLSQFEFLFLRVTVTVVAYLVTRVVSEALEALFLFTSSSNSFRVFPLLISLSSSA